MKTTEIQKQEIIDLISKERLLSYQYSKEDDFSSLIERYLYNIKISEAFYPVLSILEIALRNKIHNAIVIKPDWLLSELQSQDLLFDNEYKILSEACKKLNCKKKRITQGALIAELSFGFWINLCKKSYKPIIWDKQDVFECVFSNFSMKSEMNRIKFISSDLKLILQPRNRIFHHESLINNKLGIQNCYGVIEKILSYISEEYGSLLSEICRFKDVLKQKP